MKLTRVLLADDHALVRAGFRALLNEIKGIKVIAETGDGLEALRLIKTKRPDIVLMDIAMPGMNGLEVTEKVTKAFPEVKVIILSMHKNEEYVLQALRSGAKGYLLKDSGSDELETALKSVVEEKPFLCSAVSEQVLDDYLARVSGKSGKAKTKLGVFGKLTPRQREILQLIAEGHTTKEIATKLDISVKTVDVQRTNLMERLDIHDIAGLVRYAIRVGLVNADH
jgi:DNA-binding NarL/FixJ family response regulator